MNLQMLSAKWQIFSQPQCVNSVRTVSQLCWVRWHKSWYCYNMVKFLQNMTLQWHHLSVMAFQFTGNSFPCVSMLWCHEQTPHSLLMRVTEIWGNLFSSNLCAANIAVLTHCSLVTPQGVKVCVSIRSGSSLSFVCHQVTSSNNDLSSIGPKLKWNLNQRTKLSVQHLHLKMSSAEWWPFVSRPQWVNTGTLPF